MLMKFYKTSHAAFIPSCRGYLDALAAQTYLSARHMLKLEIGRKKCYPRTSQFQSCEAIKARVGADARTKSSKCGAGEHLLRV